MVTTTYEVRQLRKELAECGADPFTLLAISLQRQAELQQEVTMLRRAAATTHR